MGDFTFLARDEFISAMLCIHAADSSQKWLKIDDKNAKMDKSDLALSTYVQYVGNFRLWMNVAGRFHRLPETEIEMFCQWS